MNQLNELILSTTSGSDHLGAGPTRTTGARVCVRTCGRECATLPTTGRHPTMPSECAGLHRHVRRGVHTAAVSDEANAVLVLIGLVVLTVGAFGWAMAPRYAGWWLLLLAAAVATTLVGGVGLARALDAMGS